MNLGLIAAIAGGAALIYTLFGKGPRRDKVKELIKELKAAHKRINNPDDALRLSNEIGIAILELAQEEKEARTDERRLEELRTREATRRWETHVKDVGERLDAHDAKYDTVIARCEKQDAEMLRLTRKIAGEEEPAPPTSSEESPPIEERYEPEDATTPPGGEP